MTTVPSTNPLGRLAPSPTGCLHLGNVRSLLIAWLDARSRGGSVLLRIEDLDQPRAVEGADREIVDDLLWLGLDWSNELTPEYYQSNRFGIYAEHLADLRDRGLVYPCYCSRRELREAASAPHGKGGRYPGTCRDLSEDERMSRAKKKDPAWRFRVEPGKRIAFVDRLHGAIEHDLFDETGDFIVARSDGIPSYQLAVILDDIAMGVDDVIRGDDLLDSTPRQMRLYRAFDAPAPSYLHLPLMHDAEGRRLSKRTGAEPLGSFRERGYRPDEIIGYLAATIGLLDNPSPISAVNLLDRYAVDRLHRKTPYIPMPAPAQ